MMDWAQDLFIPLQGNFVPDVGFGNGWFASSDWPANKRERDGIFDPFLGVRNIICFAPGKLCFPLREIDFVTENSLPARGGETPPKSSFFTGHPMCQHRFSIDLEFSSVPSWVLLPENSFLRLVVHKKRGESCKIFPVKRYFDFNNVAKKMSDMRLVLVIIHPY